MSTLHRGMGFVGLLLAACGESGQQAPPGATDDGGAEAASVGDGGAVEAEAAPDGAADEPSVLAANPGPSRYALVDEEVVLDGSASSGATRFQWSFGNGDGWAEPRAEAVARVRYPAPGRYHAVLTVEDDLGRQRSAEAIITVTYPLTFALRGSATIAPLGGGKQFAVVSTDTSELLLVTRDADRFAVSKRFATGRGPRTVVEFKGMLAVACQDEHTVDFFDPSAGTKHTVPMPAFSGPYGVANGGDVLYVSLQASGEVCVVEPGVGGLPQVSRSLLGAPDARGVAVLPDGRVAVTRFRSPDQRGEIALIDPKQGSSSVLSLAYDPQLASDAEIGGVPTYLSTFVVSPTGREAIIPSLMANMSDGGFRNKRPLTFETTVRAALSRVDLTKTGEQFERRVQFDDLGFAIAATYSAHGDFAYVAMPADRMVRRVDLFNGTQAGSFIDAGYAPDGVALTPDDRFLLVNASLSRELAIYDVDRFPAVATPVQRLALALVEPLDAKVLRGKQLFNDAADTRIAKSGYIACSTCHFDGDSDARVWDFTDRGEGLRNTITLIGHAGAGDGPIHWTGNFDEVQDFEHDIRNAFGGSGLMADGAFHTGTRDQTLGDKKAGVSADLDALAAYVTSLSAQPRSPYRGANGELKPAALRGKSLFESAETGCTTCHAGPRLTDSKFVTPTEPLLHDVGTLSAASGQRLGKPLTGIDTPTLHGLWSSAPYLHDGSARTLRDVLRTKNPSDRHGKTSHLGDAEIDDLVAYLLSLDGKID